MPRLRRRSLLTAAAIAGAASQFPTNLQVAHAAPAASSQPPANTDLLDGGVRLRWLEGTPPALAGAAFGVPWPRGSLAQGQPLSLTTASGEAVAVQSWPTGFWPDGSVKWTAHAVGTEVAPAEEYLLEPGGPVDPAKPLSVTESHSTVTVDTGTVHCRIARRGGVLVRSIQRGDRTIATDGALVCLRKDAPAEPEAGKVRQQSFTGEVRKVRVEQRGPVRAVVRVDGVHDADRGRRGGGVLGEAVRGITGLRRDPGAAVREAQIAGDPTPDTSTWDTRVTDRLHLIPTWGDYRLRQLSDGCFEVHKRTKAGHDWIPVDIGQWRDLGTRHNVLHWGDSAKQLRISTAAYRRFYYFLTADERVGDLMRDLADAERTFLVLDPIRKIREEPYEPDPSALSIGFGTDWSALAAAWLTEWERGGDPIARQKLVNSARTIAAQPNGFVQGSGLYNLETGKFVPDEPRVSVGSLGSVFGLVEMQRAHRAAGPARVHRGLAAVLPALQRHAGGAGDRDRSVVRHPQPAPGSFPAHRVRGDQDRRRQPRRPRLAGVLHRPRGLSTQPGLADRAGRTPSGPEADRRDELCVDQRQLAVRPGRDPVPCLGRRPPPLTPVYFGAHPCEEDFP